MSQLTIDITSDVVCPWCLIGTTRLEGVLQEDGIDAEIRYHPFALMPEAPPEGLNVQDYLRAKYGGDPLRMFRTVEAAARESGIPLDLTKQAFAYPTLRAHTLLRHAAAKGTQRALSRSLYAAYFLDAKNIYDVEVLSEIASPHGFTAPEVAALLSRDDELAMTRQDMRRALEEGIRGVPFFVLNDRLAVSGAQRPEVFRAAIRQAYG